jgi:uncharacterized protein (TIGR00369 family)
VCPTDDLFGLTFHELGGGSADGPGAARGCRLTPTPAGFAADGLAPAGLLFLVADGTIGGAVFQVVRPGEVIVTTNLHLEILARPFDGHRAVTGIGGPAARYGSGASATGTMTDERGPVAAVSGRFAVLDLGSRAAGSIEADVDDDAGPGGLSHRPPTPSGSGMDDTLGARILGIGDGTIRVAYMAAPWLANERDGLHGGCGALMGERAADALLRAIAPPGASFHPVSISATYVRPIPADGSEVICTATAVHVGRSVASVRSVLATPAGKPSVVVDVVAASSPDDR